MGSVAHHAAPRVHGGDSPEPSLNPLCTPCVVDCTAEFFESYMKGGMTKFGTRVRRRIERSAYRTPLQADTEPSRCPSERRPHTARLIHTYLSMSVVLM